MDKTFSISLLVGAALGGSFLATMNKGENSVAGLSASVKSLDADTRKAGRFITLQKQVRQSSKVLSEKQNRLKQLQLELKNTEQPSDRLKARIASAGRAVNKAKLALDKQRSSLGKLRDELKKSGVATANITHEYQRMGRELDKLKAKQRDFIKLEKRKRALKAERQQKLGGIVGAGTTLVATGLLPVREAIQFEKAMVDVAKNVKGLDDENAIKKMDRDIRIVARNSTLSSSQIAKLASDAGKLGDGSEGALKFASAAEKMAIAMDLDVDTAGETIGKLRTTLQLSTDEVLSLADTINFVGDNSSSNAKNITEIVRDVGSLGISAGFTKEETVGLAAAIDGVSKSPEVAATAMKKLLTSLSKGEAAAGPAKEAFKAMGFSAEELAKNMQEDAPKALQQFIAAFDDLPEEERIARLTGIVGEEGLGPIQNLISAQDSLTKAFKISSDTQSAAGSIQKEYDRQLGTTDAQLKIAINRLSEAGNAIGRVLLPPINALLGIVGFVATGIADFADTLPVLTTIIVGFSVGLIALKFTTLGVGLAVTYMKEGWISAVDIKNKAGDVMTRLSVKQKLLTLKIYAGNAATRIAGLGQKAYAATMAWSGRMMTRLAFKQRALTAATVVGGVATRVAGTGMKFFMAGLRLASKGIKAVTVGMRIMTVAMLANPVGLIVGGIAIAAGLVIANWSKVKSFFSGLWDAIKSGWSKFSEWIGVAISNSPIGLLFKGVQAVKGLFSDTGEKVKKTATAATVAASVVASPVSAAQNPISLRPAGTLTQSQLNNAKNVQQSIKIDVKASPGREAVAAEEINRALAQYSDAGQYDQLD